MNIADSKLDIAWRKRKYCSDSNASDLNIDFMGLVASKQVKLSPPPPFFVLAEESPRRADDSDVSIYDNYHNCETDYCKDTTDTDSYTTEGIATVDVLEYEVATSSASENLYSNNSSSGTDDFVAAAVARAIFDSSTSSGSDKLERSLTDREESDGPTDPELGRADYWTCVKCKNKQNNPMYRYCERCYQIRKNHFPPRPKHRKRRSRNLIKSTPPPPSHHGRMMRTLVPNNGKNTIHSGDEDEDDGIVSDESKDPHIHDVDDNDDNRQNRKRRRNGNGVDYVKQIPLTQLNVSSVNKQNSSPSEDNDCYDANDGRTEDGDQTLGDLNDPGKYHLASSMDNIKPFQSYSIKKTIPATTTTTTTVVVQNVKQTNLTTCPIIENKFLTNVSNSERESSLLLSATVSSNSSCSQLKPTPPTQLSLTTNKDSGFSSCSSQGLSPDIFQPKELSSSQETYCSEFESMIAEKQSDDLLVSTQDKQQSLTAQTSNLSEASTVTMVSCSLRTISSCSEMLTDSLINLGDIAAAMASRKRPRSYSDSETTMANNRLSPSMTSGHSPSKMIKSLSTGGGRKFDNTLIVGLCIMCLSRPKNGVFVHSRVLHMCCCYQCAVKIWSKRKQCPICNGKVKNVMKLFVH